MRLFEQGLQQYLWVELKRGRPDTRLFELSLQLHLWAEPKRDMPSSEVAAEKEGRNERSSCISLANNKVTN
uniref:Uncharacterized protein n=1 Tax=Oryza barthii TaxID=65489 RepID=A0A0D3G294_9ORYZ